MRNISCCVLCILLALVSCTAPKSDTGTNAPAGDGLSYATAVVIKAKNETDGVRAEYAWINKHYPQNRRKEQSLDRNGGKPYDLITILLPDQSTLVLYFDISNFFGKF